MFRYSTVESPTRREKELRAEMEYALANSSATSSSIQEPAASSSFFGRVFNRVFGSGFSNPFSGVFSSIVSAVKNGWKSFWSPQPPRNLKHHGANGMVNGLLGGKVLPLDEEVVSRQAIEMYSNPINDGNPGKVADLREEVAEQQLETDTLSGWSDNMSGILDEDELLKEVAELPVDDNAFEPKLVDPFEDQSLDITINQNNEKCYNSSFDDNVEVAGLFESVDQGNDNPATKDSEAVVSLPLTTAAKKVEKDRSFFSGFLTLFGQSCMPAEAQLIAELNRMNYGG